MAGINVTRERVSVSEGDGGNEGTNGGLNDMHPTIATEVKINH